MKQLLTTAAVAAMLAASPALAADDATKQQAQTQTPAQTQPTEPAQKSDPAQGAGQSMNESMDKSATDENKSAADAGSAATGSDIFLTSQDKTDWLSSDLVGQAVQNGQGEALGDINNIVVNEDGRVVAVVIGVGGFLGIGGKDVAVSYDTLEFKERSEAAPSGGMTQSPTSPTGGSPMAQRPTATAPENPQDNIVIVLNATKQELESAPDYKYVGEEAETQSGGSGGTTSQPARPQ